ncbi:MAG: hypothetical protein A4S09_07545 [Proteobacteria bacterium SG_bin7]|nr:MAG: hypothetical protein A4S09_07545 [Proteobacteria bacterium SG_bin7]
MKILLKSSKSLTIIATLLFAATSGADDTKKLSIEEEIRDSSNTWITKINYQVPDNIVSLGNTNYFPNHIFVVDKTERSLTVWKQFEVGNLKPVRHYPTDIGKNQGDKLARGDHKTPEGIYTFLEKLEGNLDFNLYGSRAFTISYPNVFDKLLGKTGAGIWLHAVPDTVALTRGSRGCVVVRNEVIKDISQFISLQKTPIIIKDSVNYVPIDKQKEKYQVLTTMLEDWRKAWEEKSIDKYMEFYSESFHALKMNKRKWHRYKKELAEKYQNIKIKFSDPAVLEQKDQIWVRAFQDYQSNLHSDFGQKTIYLRYENGVPKIINEDWVENTDPTVVNSLNSSAEMGNLSQATNKL